MADRQQFIVRLDPDLLTAIDNAAAFCGLSRNRWVEGVLRQELAPKPSQPPLLAGGRIVRGEPDHLAQVAPRPHASARRAHAPTCACPMCKPKG